MMAIKDMDFGKNYMNSMIGTVHVFEKNRQLNDDRTREIVETTEFEWDHLENIALPNTENVETISYEQGIEYFQRIDLSKYKDKIVTTVKKKGIFTYLSCLRQTELKSEQTDDYNLLFLIAKCPYDINDKKHATMLRTVYSSMVTDKGLDFHWENIGFQSNSPWTDLRGVGMLGVLQMLYLCSNYPTLKEFLYRSSIDKFNTFPFAVVSLNMTGIVLNVLRHGKLNKDINKKGVFTSTNRVYAAIFYEFGRTWVNEKKTISDMSVILKDLEKLSLVKRSRKKILSHLEELSC